MCDTSLTFSPERKFGKKVSFVGVVLLAFGSVRPRRVELLPRVPTPAGLTHAFEANAWRRRGEERVKDGEAVVAVAEEVVVVREVVMADGNKRTWEEK